jgi:hypothetical protein
MVIGRGRRIEHPQPTFLYYYYENSTGKKVREKVREKRNGEQITGKKSTGKNSKAGQGLFRSRHFRSSMRNGPILLDPPQI